MLYLVFVIGLIFGSFLNVVIFRLKTRQSMIFGGSFCPDCEAKLKWYDLAPILSFIYLRGHCRYCGKKISLQYPIVEILSGFLWVVIFYKVFNLKIGVWDLGLDWPLVIGHWDFLYYIFIFSLLLVIAVYDFKWQIIPDEIVYPAVTIAVLYNFFSYEIYKFLNIKIFFLSLLTAFFSFLFFFSIYFFSKGKAMGLGDAKLAILIGIFLKPTEAIGAFVAAFVIGAVFGIILIELGRVFPRYSGWKMKSQIAFGPFLVFGTIMIFFFSDFLKILRSFFIIN